ncbi:MAG: ABC transporter substrate-binding protein [Oscillospiraceae bacterium]|nr:ABC transporter substrate-binding protein [Oscillospiraceae bacterium]
MKKTIALLLAAVMLLGLVACGGTGSTAAETTAAAAETTAGSASAEATTAAGGASTANVQDTLTIGTAQDINDLDPSDQNDQINNNCICLSHQTLSYLTNDAAETGITYGPMLAKEWEWEDDNTLVFHLNEGITFSDGSPLTADDCVFTFERAMAPTSKISGTLSLITSVEARDDLTFVVHTSSYSNEILSNISSIPMSILSRKAFDSGMDKPYLIGSGQYVFEDWVEGQYVKYKLNENYWGDDPGVAKEIVFKPILEAASRVIALQNGEIDVCIDPPVSELSFLQSDKNITVYEQDGTRLFYFGFNCAKAPFDNKTLRQAVSCAINKDAIVSVVLQGKGKVQNTVVNRGVWSFYDEDDLGAYTYDVDRAKELLAQAGYKEGELTIDLYAATDSPYKDIAPMIQSDLAAIGITVNIVSLDQATLKSECSTGNQQCFLWRWNVLDRLDEVYTELFTTDFSSNYHHFSDEYVDTMAKTILTEKDKDKRYDESVELQKYLAEECPQVPLYVANLVIAYRTGLTGTYLFGGGNHKWNHAYIDLSQQS